MQEPEEDRGIGLPESGATGNTELPGGLVSNTPRTSTRAGSGYSSLSHLFCPPPHQMLLRVTLHKKIAVRTFPFLNGISLEVLL